MPLRVTFVGCGTLGSVYAAELARAGAHVSALTRSSEGLREIQLERRYPLPIARFAEKVHGVRRIGQDTELLVLAVRLEQIDEPLCDMLRPWATLPLISLSPVFPSERRRLAEALGHEPICAMPAVAGYEVEDVIRYFIAPLTATLVDASGKSSSPVRQFVTLLRGAGVPARFHSRVAERNLATTVAFFPVSLALAVAGSLETLATRPDLLELASGATAEARKLARKLGPMDLGVSALTALVSPSRLAWACRKAIVKNPAFAEFLDQHFASKLKAQHRILAREISSLAEEHHVDAPRFRSLLDRFLEETMLEPSSPSQSSRLLELRDDCVTSIHRK